MRLLEWAGEVACLVGKRTASTRAVTVGQSKRRTHGLPSPPPPGAVTL